MRAKVIAYPLIPRLPGCLQEVAPGFFRAAGMHLAEVLHEVLERPCVLRVQDKVAGAGAREGLGARAQLEKGRVLGV